MKKIILLSLLSISAIVINACNSRKANEKETTKSFSVSFYKTPLVCSAAPNIGCGSKAKPVLQQLENNSPEQAMLGSFSKAVDDAIMDSSEAHRNQMMQLLSDPKKAAAFSKVVLDILYEGRVR